MDEPTARQRIEGAFMTLQKAWEVRPGDAAHAASRKFILETWPKLATPNEVRDALAPARQAFEKAKAVGDRLAVNKMHQASVEVVARFGDELKKLADNAKEEEDGKLLEAYRKVNDELIALLKDVQDYVLAEQKK